jgi:glyoxylase-like metal-dependent hydrolase (beta-lactamase superfamily II)
LTRVRELTPGNCLKISVTILKPKPSRRSSSPTSTWTTRGGAAEIRERAACRVIAPQVGRWILESGDEEGTGLKLARKQGTYPPDFRLSPCPVDVGAADGEDFEAAGIQFRAIHVRGHSENAFCYMTRLNGQNWFFTGDVVFYGGVLGVINVPGSGMDGYRSDFGKLQGLAVDGLFPGHGLLTLKGGQKHIDRALESLKKGILPPQVGQGGLVL